MPDTSTSEIVVLGAGVAGLLLAGTLAERHNVLVIERAARQTIEKYWLTDNLSVSANASFANALAVAYKEMDFVAYDDTRYRAVGDYHLWDSARLIALLRERLEGSGGRIEHGQQFLSMKKRDGHIELLVNDRAIRCRLVIDCMGYSSPIIQAKNAIDIYGYYLLYGATFCQTAPMVPVALHNMMLSAHPGYIEAFPTANNRLHLVLIVPVQQLRPMSDLRGDFTIITTKSRYAHHIDASASAERHFLGGIVPVGRMRKRALERIFFFGEAGQVNPAASATALTRMLLAHRAIATHLSECLAANDLSAGALAEATNPVGPFNQRLQRALFRSILRWKSDDFQRVVEELSCLNEPRLINALVFGDVPEEWGEIATMMRRLLHAKSKTLFAAFLRAGLPFT
jgi:flavin-dependent dehydrogenase